MRPLITGRPILESGGPFPLYVHDVRGDVGHAADNGQLGNRLVKGAVPPPLGERVLLDGAEGIRPALGGARPLRGTGVDRRKPDLTVMSTSTASRM